MTNHQAMEDRDCPVASDCRVTDCGPDIRFADDLMKGKYVNGSFGCRFFVDPYQ